MDGRAYPDLAPALNSIVDRIVDLFPPIRADYYHPEMRGSWSIKAVVPTVAPDLAYDDLDEVRDGTGAQAAFDEAISGTTTAEREKSSDRRCWPTASATRKSWCGWWSTSRAPEASFAMRPLALPPGSTVLF